MPSSIFSFERAPDGQAVRTFLIAVTVATVLLVGVEITLRSQGGTSTVPLSKSLLTANLERGIASPDPQTTLLLGASRIRSGFSSRVFADRAGQTPLIYIASSGESSLAVLVYLAEKTNFSGKLVVAMSAQSLSGSALNDQEYIVRYHEDEWNWNNQVNHFIGARISSNVVFRQNTYAFSYILRSLIDYKKLPPVPYWRRHTLNGESFYDFSLLDVAEGWDLVPHRLYLGTADPNDPSWEMNFSRLNAAIRRLAERGATIALVRFPTSGNTWLNEQARWPRDRFWDRIPTPPGTIKLHFRDVDAMKRFILPDASHIDQRDKDAFTRVLLDELQLRGMTWRK